MKKVVKFLSFLLAVGLVLSFISCSSTPKYSSPPESLKKKTAEMLKDGKFYPVYGVSSNLPITSQARDVAAVNARIEISTIVVSAVDGMVDDYSEANQIDPARSKAFATRCSTILTKAEFSGSRIVDEGPAKSGNGDYWVLMSVPASVVYKAVDQAIEQAKREEADKVFNGFKKKDEKVKEYFGDRINQRE